MSRPTIQCQCCGRVEDSEIVRELSNENPDEMWMVTRIEQKGGFVQVLICPDCIGVSHDLILETYKERIRHGLVPGFH